AKVAGRLVAEDVDRLDSSLKAVESRSQAREKTFTRLGESDTARRAIQQPNAKPVLQPANGGAQRGARHAELTRALRKARVLGHHDEGIHRGESGFLHCSNLSTRPFELCMLLEQ